MGRESTEAPSATPEAVIYAIGRNDKLRLLSLFQGPDLLPLIHEELLATGSIPIDVPPVAGDVEQLSVTFKVGKLAESFPAGVEIQDDCSAILRPHIGPAEFSELLIRLGATIEVPECTDLMLKLPPELPALKPGGKPRRRVRWLSRLVAGLTRPNLGVRRTPERVHSDAVGFTPRAFRRTRGPRRADAVGFIPSDHAASAAEEEPPPTAAGHVRLGARPKSVRRSGEHRPPEAIGVELPLGGSSQTTPWDPAPAHAADRVETTKTTPAAESGGVRVGPSEANHEAEHEQRAELENEAEDQQNPTSEPTRTESGNPLNLLQWIGDGADEQLDGSAILLPFSDDVLAFLGETTNSMKTIETGTSNGVDALDRARGQGVASVALLARDRAGGKSWHFFIEDGKVVSGYRKPVDVASCLAATALGAGLVDVEQAEAILELAGSTKVAEEEAIEILEILNAQTLRALLETHTEKLAKELESVAEVAFKVQGIDEDDMHKIIADLDAELVDMRRTEG